MPAARTICMAKLGIVWRNPNPIENRRRWLPQQLGAANRTYIIQELVCADADIWAGIASLEVSRRCEATRQRPAQKPSRWLRVW